MGITRVRPLLGGFHEWKRLDYPLEEVPGAVRWNSTAVQA